MAHFVHGDTFHSHAGYGYYTGGHGGSYSYGQSGGYSYGHSYGHGHISHGYGHGHFSSGHGSSLEEMAGLMIFHILKKHTFLRHERVEHMQCRHVFCLLLMTEPEVTLLLGLMRSPRGRIFFGS